MITAKADRHRVGSITYRPGARWAAWGLAAAFVIAACANTTTPAPAPTGAGQTATTATPTTPATPAAAATSATGMRRSVPLRVRIPAIGVDAALVSLGLQADGTLAVPSQAMTAGWYTGAPTPGELGPAVIAGHVHWSGRPGVFYHLANLKPGDRVIVSRTDRTTATFTVVRVATFAKTRFPSQLVYGDIDFAGLRLITCGGFDPVADAYEANVIVFAKLVTD
ncbi:MAG: class F sortase [Actinomycetia bacterium]|nr:class F sortase [Actinomycetes bacterium]